MPRDTPTFLTLSPLLGVGYIARAVGCPFSPFGKKDVEKNFIKIIYIGLATATGAIIDQGWYREYVCGWGGGGVVRQAGSNPGDPSTLTTSTL